MVTILDEIIEKLKSHSFSIPVKDIRDPYSSKTPVYPMIVVEETRNTPDLQLHGKVIRSNLNYKFEIYGRDTISNGEVMSKRQVVVSIFKELDEIMREIYGMKINVSPTILAATDKSVLRHITTYGGIIDNDTMIIYQR